MFEYSDYDSWAAWDDQLTRASRQEWDESRPTCAWCGEKITDEYAYVFPDGDVVCEECVGEYIDEAFRKPI